MKTCETCTLKKISYESSSCYPRKYWFCNSKESNNSGCKLDIYNDSCNYHNQTSKDAK